MVQERSAWAQHLALHLTAAYVAVPPAGANRQSALELLASLLSAHESQSRICCSDNSGSTARP
jgi:hypothetical protein